MIEFRCENSLALIGRFKWLKLKTKELKILALIYRLKWLMHVESCYTKIV